MNTLERPPIDPLQYDRSPGDHDDLLRSFFQAEMPSPWPTLNLPEPVLTLDVPRRNLATARSRLALAASVALLVLTSWLISGALRDKVAAPANSHHTDTANNRLMKELSKDRTPLRR